MSAQFGRWHFDGIRPTPNYLAKVSAVLAPYGPDGGSSYSQGGVDILYSAFHATKESRRELQPCALPSGDIIMWDGRLDNRAEFISLLRDSLSQDSADVSIVAAAYERWGTECFARLIGDWALSIWSPKDRSLVLAKDFLGARHLYYSAEKDQVTWSTILDPLVLFGGKTLAIDEEYIAGWLGTFPATHLTPYSGIRSVPPSCFVRLEPERQEVRKYWDFDPRRKIRYRADAEYEEHYRQAFAESVRRRLRSDSLIVAELSGGMDSSSVVCVADTLIARGRGESPRLDTLSYYNDSEPNWNERPYFTKVEEQRGRTGCHIEVGFEDAFQHGLESDRFVATPGSGGRTGKAAKEFKECMNSQGSRVLLSGIGGDEVAGGVPTPIPELANLVATAQFKALTHQLKRWALCNRKPWFRLLLETTQRFLPSFFARIDEDRKLPLWLDPEFVTRNRHPLMGYPSRLELFGPPPCFQENAGTLDLLRRQLACAALSCDPLYETRYAHLDRDLLEFLFAVPPEQLVRPGQRRSLTRRALRGIVPDEVLNRKRKAFVIRAPRAAAAASWSGLLEMSQEMVCSSHGIVDKKAFCEAVEKARRGQEVPIALLIRTIKLETWLRGWARWKPQCEEEGQAVHPEAAVAGTESPGVSAEAFLS
jgi:asparagine synthase (glutamine-hydrolysing)